MGIFSNQDLFSDSQAVTADAGSTNIIDLKATGTPVGAAVALARDLGKGCRIPLEVLVTEAFNNLTTLQISVQVDDNDVFSSAKTVALSRTYALSELTLGARLNFPAQIPEGTDERYLRLYYDVVGTAPSTGKLFAGVVMGRQNA